MNREIEQSVEVPRSRFARSMRAATLVLGMTVGTLGAANAAYASRGDHEDRFEHDRTEEVDLSRFDCDDDRMWEELRPESEHEHHPNHDNLEFTPDKDGQARFEWQDWKIGTPLVARICADNGELVKEIVFDNPEPDAPFVYRDGPKDRPMVHLNHLLDDFEPRHDVALRLAIFSEKAEECHNGSAPLFDISEVVKIKVELPPPPPPEVVMPTPEIVVPPPKVVIPPPEVVVVPPPKVKVVVPPPVVIEKPVPMKELPKTGRHTGELVMAAGALFALGGASIRRGVPKLRRR